MCVHTYHLLLFNYSFAVEDSYAEITLSESEVLEDSDDCEPASKKKINAHIPSKILLLILYYQKF